MKRLGCVIKKVSGGLTSIFECNSGDWSKKCSDIRDYLKYFDGIDDFNNFITLISFDEKGCFLTILKPISGRSGDCLIAYIYISNSIKISGKNVKSVYEDVKKCLSENTINNEKLNQLFSKEYEPNDIIVSYTPSPSQSNRFGYRRVGTRFSFQEVLGEDRYQTYYSGYKAIFILEGDNGVTISDANKKNFVDMTNDVIGNNCILRIDQSHLCPDVRIMCNNEEFNQGSIFKKGDKVQLHLERPGFEPIKLGQIEIKERVQTEQLPNNLDWEVIIKSDIFIITDEEGKKIENPRIQVNDKQISWGGVCFKEKDLQKSVRVTIEAAGFEKYSKELKLQIPDGIIQIILGRKTITRWYDIRLANGHDAKIGLESKYLSSNDFENESPIIGYDLSYKRLDPSSWYIWKQRILGFVSAAILALFIFLCMVLGDWLGIFHVLPRKTNSSLPQCDVQANPNYGDYDTVSEPGPIESDENKASSSEDAIKYLDSNDIWSKSEMEKYSNLKDLFDDMNNFNLDNILGKWKESLSTSNKFKKICDSAQKNKSNYWNPKQGLHNPTYNKPNDEKINITNYINWLDQDQTSKVKDKVGKQKENKGEKKENGGL